MSELDRVLDTVMKDKVERIMKPVSDEKSEEREELISALRERIKQKIIEEIREEYKEELIQEADKKVKRKSERQKIEDLKSLMWSGFLLAFIVGLAVNQATDFIGYYKGTVIVDKIWPTTVITVIFCLICLAAYLYSFWQKVITIYDDWKKDKNE